MEEEIPLKKETSKWELTVSIGDNPPILSLNEEVSITHFESDTRQLFETKEGSFVYFKDTNTLHKVDTNKYTSLLLKLILIQDEAEQKEKEIQHLKSIYG